MNRKERRRARKQAAGGAEAGGAWVPPTADAVAGALLQHAAGTSPLAGADPQAELRIAVGHLESGHPGEAEPHLQAVLEVRPDDPVAMQLSGVVAFELGRGEEALERLRQAVATAPDYPEAQHNLALVLLAHGQAAEAARHFRQALDLRPDYPQAHLNLGNALRAAADFAGAQAAYEAVLEEQPDLVEARLNLANVLRERGDDKAALAEYDRVVEQRPDYGEAHHNRGICLGELGRQAEAIAAHRRALELAPDDAEVAFAFREAMRQRVPDWHMKMLADAGRNDAFAQALARQVRPGMTVLDVGSGSGLLAMMAARAGAAHVYAVEGIGELAEVAREVVGANGFADRITVLDGRSTELRIGAELPERVDLVVAEVFDSGLLGERALTTLRHAGQQLMQPGGVMLPASADVYAMLVSLPRWRSVNPVADIAGFDLSAFDRFRNPYTYLQCDLASEPHAALSAPFHVAHFDFRDPPPPVRSRTIEVPATAAGEVHAVAFWFELQLDDAVSLSTAPGRELDHWRQAVQFFDQGRSAMPGEQLTLTVGHTDTRIYFEL